MGTLTFADIYGGGAANSPNPASEPTGAKATGAPASNDNAPGMTFAGIVIALVFLRILWERAG